VRILITGGRGQLSRDLQAELADHEVAAPGGDELDVTDPDACERAISSFRPSVVVHTAALTDTKRCEAAPGEARRVNALGASHVAQACARASAAMAYISTNEVFDGAASSPYPEDAAPNPINHYGRSKLEGERLVSEVLQQTYIVRTSWLFGPGGQSFVTRVQQAAAAGALVGVTDETATPTSTRDLARAISQLVVTDAFGVYHFTNAGEASRYDWAREIVRLSGLATNVSPVTTNEFRASLPADAALPHKPRYSVLQNGNGARLGVTLRHWKEALEEYISRKN
jgi:dTDP-4-dehydrorhamnose reductase